MRLGQVLARFSPGPLTSLIYWLKYRCFISPRAEVELSATVTFGRGTKIGSFTKIKASRGRLVVGRNVSVGSGCFIGAGTGGNEIGDDCLISNHVTILSTNYRYDRLDLPIAAQGSVSKGVRIGSNVWLGSGVVVLDGAQIGAGTIVTPNSVVSGRLPPNVIAQGNPAKVIFERR
jgi:acetyltransferase-like isoleucine patch superfamily enzyme